jgi:hypothetical protein
LSASSEGVACEQPLVPQLLGGANATTCMSYFLVGWNLECRVVWCGSNSSEQRGPNNLAMNIDLRANLYHNLPDNQMLTIMGLNYWPRGGPIG